MPAPRWLARFNLHVTNHFLGPIARYFPGMGIIVHRGRKSRRRYRTPVVLFRRGDGFVIALTYGRESQWVLNLIAEGGGELETRGRILRISQPRLIHDERRSIMPLLIRPMLAILNVSDFLEVNLPAT
jgi:deazaflavin-dependent oxidoreductase (nitroreductase family)